MTNHHDEMRVAPDPSRAEELRQRLHARLASGRAPVVEEWKADERTIPSADTDPDHRGGDLIMLETENHPTDHEPVTPRDRSPGRWLLVAAVAAVVAVVGTLLVAAGGDDDEDQVVPATSTPTTAPAQNVLGSGDLEPGRYFIDPDGDDTTPLRVTYQVAAEGWGSWIGAMKSPRDGHTAVTITTVPNLVTDGCRDHTPLDPPVGPTVDDLATALSRLAPFEVTAPPTDVTLLGYQGKHLALTVPVDLRVDSGAENFHDFADCLDGELHSWISTNNEGSFSGYEAPGHTEEFWILDVQGTRLVLVKDASPNMPAQDIAERDAIFDTIRIEP
jgi:hypothetical protein